MKTSGLLLARMCKASYNLKKDDGDLPRFIRNYRTTEYVEIRQQGRTAYIVFRGSDDMTDWARNADFHLVRWSAIGWSAISPVDSRFRRTVRMRRTPRGRISHGFHKGIMELINSVHACTDDLDVDRIICTGHSRGGPLAILCHEHTERRRPDVSVSSVVFGCPNFCDDEYVASCSQMDIVAYDMGAVWLLRDPVPHIPAGHRRPGNTVTLRGFGRPSKMHKLKRYIRELSR